MSIDFGPHPHGTKVPHLHAESMLLYAQDAMETDRPWERWECSDNCGGEWGSLSNHPIWGHWINYRRKPRTILINGIEVPEPVKQDLEPGRLFFLVNILDHEKIYSTSWNSNPIYDMWLKRGLIHLTEENARKHVEALLSFTKK